MRSLPLQITLLSVAPTSVTHIPAPTPRIGIPVTRPHLVRRSRIFPKFRGMTRVPGNSSLLMRVTRSLMAHRVSATTPPSAHFCKPPLLAVAVPVNARLALPRSIVSSAAHALVGRNLRGNPSLAIRATVSVIPRTFLYLLRTVFGATFMFFVGRTRLRVVRRAAPIPALGPVRAEHPLLPPSWRASKRSSTKKRGARRGILHPFITSLLRQNTVRAAAAPATPITEMPLVRAAFSTM